MPVIQLSRDIIHCIVNELHPSFDRQSLFACSLVSSPFRHSSQRRLFSSFYICLVPDPQPIRRYPGPGLSISTFRDLFALNPSLGTFVRRLHLWGLSISSRNETLHDLHHFLPNLNALSKDGGCSCNPSAFYMIPPWGTLNPKLRANILNIIHSSPALSSLSIEAVPGFPLSWITQSCSRLKRLRLALMASTDFGDEPDAKPPLPLHPGSPPTKGYIEDLAVSRADAQFRVVEIFNGSTTSSLDLSHLRSYDVFITRESDFAPTRVVYNASRQTLQEITFRLVIDTIVSPDETMDFGSLTNLKSLTFHLTGPADRYRAPVVFGTQHRHWIGFEVTSRAAETLQPTSQLREFHLFFYPGSVLIDTGGAFLSAAWSRLDIALSRLKCLQSVVFWIVGYASREGVFAALEARLPSVVSKELLRVEFSQ